MRPLTRSPHLQKSVPPGRRARPTRPPESRGSLPPSRHTRRSCPPKTHANRKHHSAVPSRSPVVVSRPKQHGADRANVVTARNTGGDAATDGSFNVTLVEPCVDFYRALTAQEFDSIGATPSIKTEASSVVAGKVSATGDVVIGENEACGSAATGPITEKVKGTGIRREDVETTKADKTKTAKVRPARRQGNAKGSDEDGDALSGGAKTATMDRKRRAGGKDGCKVKSVPGSLRSRGTTRGGGGRRGAVAMTTIVTTKTSHVGGSVTSAPDDVGKRPPADHPTTGGSGGGTATSEEGRQRGNS